MPFQQGLLPLVADLLGLGHVEYHCACGQRLQWDHPVKAIAHAALLISGPQPCAHATLCTPEARFPCAGPCTVEWQTGREEERRVRAAGVESDAEKMVPRAQGKRAPECEGARR